MAKKKSYAMPCSECDALSAKPVFCGYCKERSGQKTMHYLCDKCFMKGCPVAYKLK